MKKRYLVIGSLAFFQFIGHAQSDTIIERVNKTEIELVYNHYSQDGNNSAVTGGIGTEKLIVYGPMLNVKRNYDKNAMAYNMGVDIISSASTDKIDYVMSSASSLDARSYLNATYERTFKDKSLIIYGGTGFSIESDYFSIGSKIGVIKDDKKRLRTYNAQFQLFNDDLRWGRLSSKTGGALKLIYPFELRNQQWYDEYKRNTFNLKFGVTQVLNKRNILGIFPDFTVQKGLLATPFHRIYFNDGSKRVEQLPYKRLKGAVGVRLNSFYGGRLILKNTINGYADTWKIYAFSFENEIAFKLNHQFTFIPNFRVYAQSASPFFEEYGMHDPDSEYYTSDFDLNKIQTYNSGFGIRFSPIKYISKSEIFNSLLIKYNYYHRSNDLNAHIFTIAVQMEFLNQELKK